MVIPEFISFRKAQAHKTAELLLRTLPDFYSGTSTVGQTHVADTITHSIARSVKKRHQLAITSLLHAGFISVETADLALSHPIIARAAVRILQADPTGLQGPLLPTPRLTHETMKELREATARQCNISRLLRRGFLDWKDATVIVRQGIQQGCITSEQALYALGDGEAVVQLARALKLRRVMAT